MKLWITETEKVKRQAGEDAVIILQLWKQKVRRLRIYRACLCAALILAGMGLFGYSYYLVDSSIPSVIYMRAESEESLVLDIPAKGEILSVSEQFHLHLKAVRRPGLHSHRLTQIQCHGTLGNITGSLFTDT